MTTDTRSTTSSLPFWRQIRSNLIFYFILLAVIPIVILTFNNYREASADAKEQTFDKLESVGELKASQINQWLSDSQAALTLVTTALPYQIVEDTAMQTGSNPIFAASTQAYPNFSEFFVYNAAGQVVSASDTSQLNKIVSRQPYFNLSLQEATVHPPYFDLASGDLTIIVTHPIRNNNNDIVGALAGKLNLNILSRIMADRVGLGDTGETYLVSNENNYLLTPSRFEGYELTRAYHSEGIDRALEGEQHGQGEYLSYRNVEVLGSYHWVPSVQAGLLAEIETNEALESAIASRNANIAIAAVAITIAAIAGFYFATRVSRPITQLTETAARLASGDFQHRAKIERLSEIGVLGDTFNQMADQIQDMVANLENRVVERTKDMEATLAIGRIATSITASEDLLPQIVEAIRDRFQLYYTQIYLLDEAQRYAILRAGTGTVGQRLIQQKHRLDLSETSIVSRTVQAGQPILVSDTESSPIHLLNPLLPDTRSEAAFPLVVGNETLGVLDMQASTANTFNEQNVHVFETMATTLAGILQSNAAFDEARTAIQKADAINRRLTRQNWEGYLARVREHQKLGYQYDLEAPTPLDEWTTLPDEANKDATKPQALLPIKLAGQQIGNILVREDWEREWTPEELSLVEDVAARVAQAVEQLRAFDETEARARELATVAEVSTRVSSTLDPDEMLQSVTDLTKDSFNLYHAHIYLLDNTKTTLVLTAGAGEIGRRMVAAHHAIALNHEHSLVARSARTHKAVVSNNVAQEPDFLPNMLLPNTKSEMAVPIIVGDELLGVFDVQASALNRFSEKDAQVQTTLAGQIAVALANARTFQEVERARRETERIYNSSIDMLGSSTIEGFFVSLNPAWEQTLGFSNEELMSSPYVNFVHPDDLDNISQDGAKLMEGNPVSFVARYLCKDGSYKWLSLNASPDLPNNLIHLVARDITLQRHAEEDLRKLSRAVEQSPSMTVITDTKGKIEYVNPTFLKVTQYAIEEVIGKTPAILQSGQTPREVYTQMWETILAGKDWHGEVVNRKKDGSFYWADLNITPVRNNSGVIAHFLEIQNDITDRKQSEEDLRQARAQAELLYQVSALINEAITEKDIIQAIVKHVVVPEISSMALNLYDDPETRLNTLVVADWRRDGSSITGLRFPVGSFPFAKDIDANETFFSNNIYEDPRFDEASVKALKQFDLAGILFTPLAVGNQLIGLLTITTNEPYTFTSQFIRSIQAIADQAAVTLERLHLLHQTEKRAVELQVVAEVSTVAAGTLNKSELLQTFSNLTRDSFNLYHAHVYLLNDAQDALVLTAGAGEIGQKMVEENHRISLYAEHSMVARAARTGEGVISNDVAREPSFLPNPLLPETRSELSLPIFAVDRLMGVLDVQSDRYNHFTEDDSRIMSALAAQLGVALANAELYEEQLETSERLREVDKLKSEFLASMSHELRTPLNSIIGYAEVMLDGLDGPLSEEMREDVSAIHGGGKLLLSLINDILDLAKIEAGQMELEYEDIRLGNFLDRIIETSQILVKQKPVTMQVRKDSSFPENIQADPIRLQQIINNLLSNAAKFTEDGSITLAATVKGDMLHISVEDTGVGIPSDKIELIFERFRQADQSSTRRKGGTGLGLDITRRLVHMHGGKIWAESSPNAGSIFTFTLPLTKPDFIPHEDNGNGIVREQYN